MTDEIEYAGSQAWRDGKGERDCPYPDVYEQTPGGYWTSRSGMRQRWMGGYHRAWQQNEIIQRNRTWPRLEWTWEET